MSDVTQFSVTTVAQLVHVSEGTVKGEIRTGRLKASSMPGPRAFWLIDRADLVAWYNALLAGKTFRDTKIVKEIDEICRVIGVDRSTLLEQVPAPAAAVAVETKQKVRI